MCIVDIIMSKLQTPNTSEKEPSDSDINDIFDEIALCEDRTNAQGYQKGVVDGSSAGNTDGYHLGYHRGAELGAELGYYYGMLLAYLKNGGENTTDRQQKSIESVLKLIDNFPRTNDDQADIFSLADNIRAQYRRTCAILKINGKYPDSDQLSF